MARRQVSIYINGKEVEGSIKRITSAKRQLVNELNRMVIGSQEYEDTISKIKDLDGVLSEHRAKLRGVEQGYSGLKAGAKDFLTGAAAGFAGAFAVDQIVAFGTELFNTAGQMELLQRKAQIVFGETLPEVTAQAELNARAMGLTTQQYINQSAAIADLLVPMGFQRTEAANISTELVNLGGALAEWTGGQRSAEEVTQILGDAILGERDALKSLGIDIQQTEIDAKLAEKGLKDLTGEFRQQAEAATTLELILQKSQDAQTAYATNTGTIVRRQAELRARTTEVIEDLSVALLPVFERLVSVAGIVATGIEGIGQGFTRLLNPAKAAREEFAAQSANVQSLEKNLVPLLDRYDELQSKSELSKTEQAELSKIIAEIGKITPTAVTQIDDYGNALSINAQNSRDFLEAEKARLLFTQREAIQATENEIDKLKERQRVLKIELESQKGYRDSAFARKLTNDELIESTRKLSETTTLLTGAERELKRLRGENDAPVTNTPTTTDTPPKEEELKRRAAANAAAAERKKEQERQQKELEQHLKQLQDITDKYANDAALAQLSDAERSAETIRQRYDKEIAIAVELESKGVKQATAIRLELERLKGEELAKLRDEQLAAELNQELDRQNALAEQALQFEQQREQVRQQLKEQADSVLLSESEQAIQQLEAQYAILLQQAEAYGIETNRIEEAYQLQKAEIQRKYLDKEKKEIFDRQKERLQALATAYQSFGTAVGTVNDFLVENGLENSAIQKVLAIAQIGLKTAEGIANAVAAGAGIPFPGNLPAIASGVAAVLTNMAAASKVLSQTRVPQRFMGGFFDVTGQTDGRTYNAQYIGRPGTGILPSRPVLLASERGPEYFVSNTDLQNPRIMDHVRAIENLSAGRSVPQYASGGSTNTLPTPSTDPRLLEVLVQTNTINQLMLERLDSLQARIDDDTIIEIQRRMNVLNSAAGQ